MKHSVASPLASLHRLLELRLEQARLALARTRRAAERHADAARHLLQLRQEQARDAVQRLDVGFDPAHHRQALQQLAVLAGQHHAAECELRSARAALAQAAARGLEADRRQAVVGRLLQQEAALRRIAASRADSKEADLQWLVRQAAGSRRTPRDGGDT